MKRGGFFISPWPIPDKSRRDRTSHIILPKKMGVVLALGALLSTVMWLRTVSIVVRAFDTNYEKLPLLSDMA